MSLFNWARYSPHFEPASAHEIWLKLRVPDRHTASELVPQQLRRAVKNRLVHVVGRAEAACGSSAL